MQTRNRGDKPKPLLAPSEMLVGWIAHFHGYDHKNPKWILREVEPIDMDDPTLIAAMTVNSVSFSLLVLIRVLTEALERSV